MIYRHTHILFSLIKHSRIQVEKKIKKITYHIQWRHRFAIINDRGIENNGKGSIRCRPCSCTHIAMCLWFENLQIACKQVITIQVLKTTYIFAFYLHVFTFRWNLWWAFPLFFLYSLNYSCSFCCCCRCRVVDNIISLFLSLFHPLVQTRNGDVVCQVPFEIYVHSSSFLAWFLSFLSVVHISSMALPKL